MRFFKEKPPEGARMTMKSGMEWEVLLETQREVGNGEFSIKARPLVRYLRHEEYSVLLFNEVDVETMFERA